MRTTTGATGTRTAIRRRRRVPGALAAAAVAALLGACTAAPPTPPGTLPAPPVSVERPALDEALVGMDVPPPDPVVDELLASPMLRHPEFRAEVDRWVAFWTGRGSSWFPVYLERMGSFSPTVDAALEERGLPRTLRYLPIIESGYSPRAVSSASAVGLWQFMAPTARGFGMGIDPLVDERRNPFKSTGAATAYLQDLRARFGSWFLALSAYNAGPGRIERLLDRHAPLAPRTDSLWWELRPHMPRETRDFVPKLFAAAELASRPEAHGFGPLATPVGFAFDEVVVPDATTLDVVARAAETSEAEIQRLNPELVRGITPPGREMLVRVPPGHGFVFRRNYAAIPPSERVTFVEHRVRPGETLSHVARRYGVPVRDLEAANPTVRARYLQIGQRLVVPVAPSVRRGG